MNDLPRYAEETSEERADVERGLNRAQVLAAVSSTADLIAHEIGSPLNIILGRARLAAASPDCPESIRTDLEMIASQCDRISQAVWGLLAASRIPRPNGDACDVAEVAERVIQFVEPDARWYGVNVALEIRESQSGAGFNTRVGFDEERVFQILFNLCMNALEVRAEGGRVVFRLAPSGHHAHIGYPVVLDIEDQGPAVQQPQEQAKDVPVSSLFSDKSGKVVRRARDLRLMLARELIANPGGSIELLPGGDGGTVYRVIFQTKSAPLMEEERRR
jgi:signal transduction histidine kinase